MKKHTKFISVILCILLTLSLTLMPVYAVRAPIQYGDIGNNGIDIMDATFVQRCVAQLQEYGQYTFLICDVDADGELSVVDATLIQKYVAKQIDKFPAGVVDYVDLYAEALTSDYGSGKAQVGTPVTFTAHASGFMGPFIYNFYVDGETVKSGTTENTLVYTFDTAGTHSVGFDVTNRAGICVAEYIDFTVGDSTTPDGSLTINNVFHHGFYDSSPTFEVVVAGGKPNYSYSYKLYEYEGGVVDANSMIIETPLMENQNTFTYGDFVHGKRYLLAVTVTDADGDSVMSLFEFDYMLPPPA